MSVIKTLTVFGTRPEAIKLAPVVRAFEADPRFDSVVCVTGQHRAMLDQMLGFFGMRARHDLDVMQPDQTLTALAARTLERLQPVLDAERPDWLVVQGDTTTAMAAALGAFYNKIRVAHVEAGLRTRDKRAPYPEEVNRRMIGATADLHLAPTQAARAALLAEGEPDRNVVVTGNTGIDALYWTQDRVRAGQVSAPEGLEPLLDGRRLVLVTAHRRENFDGGLAQICAAIQALVQSFEDIAVVLPVHPNPNVKAPIEKALSHTPRVHLTQPVDYGPFVWLLDRAALILTDSGGIQEEATALGRPMLVMRDVTERPEAIASGNGLLVGAHQAAIVEQASRLLADPAALAAMARPSDVFGDGRAAGRIVEALATWRS